MQPLAYRSPPPVSELPRGPRHWRRRHRALWKFRHEEIIKGNHTAAPGSTCQDSHHQALEGQNLKLPQPLANREQQQCRRPLGCHGQSMAPLASGGPPQRLPHRRQLEGLLIDETGTGVLKLWHPRSDGESHLQTSTSFQPTRGASASLMLTRVWKSVAGPSGLWCATTTLCSGSKRAVQEMFIDVI